jgi:hypothetical protein
MGSVKDPYTTGDNDPEITPERYFRHYLYCDACGSFELDSWMSPENAADLERTRQKLERAAWLGVPLLLVSGWQALGLIPSPVWLFLLAAGVTMAVLVRVYFMDLADPRVHAGLRFVKRVLLGLPAVALVQWIGAELLPPGLVLVALGIGIAGLLIGRGVLGAKLKYLGLRCAECRATYAHGTAFFTDLDANPRGLTVAEVPRPLGSSRFLRGVAVDE